MKKNLGNSDRIIRLVLAALMLVLFLTNIVTGTAGFVLLAVAVILILTSLVSFCPLYALMGIKTCPTKS